MTADLFARCGFPLPAPDEQLQLPGLLASVDGALEADDVEPIFEDWAFRPNFEATFRVASGSAVEVRASLEKAIFRGAADFVCAWMVESVLLFNYETPILRCSAEGLQLYMSWGWRIDDIPSSCRDRVQEIDD